MFCISTIVQWIILWSTSFISCNVFKAPSWSALIKTSSIFFLLTKSTSLYGYQIRINFPWGWLNADQFFPGAHFPFLRLPFYCRNAGTLISFSSIKMEKSLAANPTICFSSTGHQARGVQASRETESLSHRLRENLLYVGRTWVYFSFG